MLKRPIIRLLTVFLLLSACSLASAEATMIVKMNLEKLTAGADLIITGQVSEMRTAWDYRADKPQIYTYVTLAVAERIKGECEDAITIRLRGGAVENDDGTYTVSTVMGMPRFTPDEEVLLFLKSDYATATGCPIIGWGQGKLIPSVELIAQIESYLCER